MTLSSSELSFGSFEGDLGVFYGCCEGGGVVALNIAASRRKAYQEYISSQTQGSI